MIRASTRLISIATLAVLGACGETSGNRASPSTRTGLEANAVGDIAPTDSISAAKPALAELPKEIDEWAHKEAANCRTILDGTYHGYDKRFRTADFNADGRPDYILSEANIDCRGDGLGNAEEKWGKVGPENDFLISSPTGYMLVQGFGSYDDAITIRKDAKGDRLVVAVSLPIMECPAVQSAVWALHGNKMSVVERLDDKGKPVRCGGEALAAKSGLPVPFGKYAVNTSCAEAGNGNFLSLSPKYWGEIDGDTPIGPFRNLGGDRWSLGSGITITITGPKSFVEGGRQMTWCKG